MAHSNVRPAPPAVVPTDALHACPVPIDALLLRAPALLLVALLLICCPPRSTTTMPAQGEALDLGAEAFRSHLLLRLRCPNADDKEGRIKI
jgi:hypothetical protein